MQKQDFSLTTIVNWHSKYIVILWFYGFIDKDLQTAVGWNISGIQLWMGICIAGQNDEYSNPSVYKWSVYELMVIPESQINTYFSIC